jgi:beta-1,4-mannosyl-glycoprotein beta-1,4-N-acetylglucosaminyltransferase
MLEFRLTELNDYVDHFILVESTQTFAGNPKKLYYNDNKNIFAKFNDKITHIIVNDTPETNCAWTREEYQRNCISRGVNKLNLKDADIIVIADVDEIPNTKILRDLKSKINLSFNGLHILICDMYIYNLTCKISNIWCHPKIMNYGYFKTDKPHNIRHTRSKQSLEHGGWHFSYFGDADFIVNKLRQFSHQEYNNSIFADKERIEHLIKTNASLFPHYDKLMYISIEDNTFLPTNYKMLLNTSNDEKYHIASYETYRSITTYDMLMKIPAIILDCGNKLFAYYGAADSYYDVTKVVIANFMNNHKIIIDRNCRFNYIFGDPCIGVVKQLIIMLNDKRYTIDENFYKLNDDDIIIQIQ